MLPSQSVQAEFKFPWNIKKFFTLPMATLLIVKCRDVAWKIFEGVDGFEPRSNQADQSLYESIVLLNDIIEVLNSSPFSSSMNREQKKITHQYSVACGLRLVSGTPSFLSAVDSSRASPDTGEL